MRLYLLHGYQPLQVSLATDFMYNSMSRDATASVGYDYILRQVYFGDMYIILLQI